MGLAAVMLAAAGVGVPVDAGVATTVIGNSTVVEAQGSLIAPPTARISGADRYATAVEVSRHAFPTQGSARSVYLARGDIFADSLTAGTLVDGPVLLVRPDCRAVTSGVMAEVERLRPDRVVALGGEAAVCDEQLAAAAAGRSTHRLGGADRFQTAAAIAHDGFPEGARTVYLINGDITPDAVVGGSLGDGPMLLTTRDGAQLPESTLEAIALLDPDEVVALGGTAVVSDGALAVAGEERRTARIGGTDRYATARAVAQRAYPEPTGRAYVARGDGSDFVDALVAGVLTDGPVLLAAGPCRPVNAQTRAALGDLRPDEVVALGGTSAVCAPLLNGAAMAARGSVDCEVSACVALTYDDGPSTRTPTILEIFASARVPATFYLVGSRAAARPQDTMRTQIEGHEIGNHSYDHVRLNTLSLAAQRDQIDRTDDVMVSLGLPVPRTLRPPYLAFDGATRELGKPVVIADVIPDDHVGYSAAVIRKYVADHVQPGSIVLLHDHLLQTQEATPLIIDDLHARGYTFVTVSELVPEAAPGDLVYSRGTIIPRSTSASMRDLIELPDGRVIGPVVDTAGVPGLAPELTREEVLGPDDDAG